LVGGRGHWTYAVNKGLLTNESVRPGAGASASDDESDDAGDDAGASDDAGALSGGNAPYKVRTTKKIKNKYYRKGSLPSSSSSSSSLKTTKKHKKTRRMNKNKKRIKKTIKL
jgi:hypothetical protein